MSKDNYYNGEVICYKVPCLIHFICQAEPLKGARCHYGYKSVNTNSAYWLSQALCNTVKVILLLLGSSSFVPLDLNAKWQILDTIISLFKYFCTIFSVLQQCECIVLSPCALYHPDVKKLDALPDAEH